MGRTPVRRAAPLEVRAVGRADEAPPQDLFEKLEPPKRVVNTRAQATLEQLLARRGAPTREQINTRDTPRTIEVYPIKRAAVEVWVRVGGGAGLATVYELDHEREILP